MSRIRIIGEILEAIVALLVLIREIIQTLDDADMADAINNCETTTEELRRIVLSRGDG